MNIEKFNGVKTLTLFFILFSFQLFAADQQIENVIKKMNWTSFSADMTLNLKRGSKEPVTKKMHVQAKEAPKGQKILAMFTFPSNMKGMTFLAHCNKNLKDKRYIYLRTLRRVKKVPANGDNFMLRDFLSLYLLKPRTELWDYSKVSEKDNIVVIKAMAKSSKTINITGYKYLIMQVDTKSNMILSTEFYGKNNKKRRIQKVLSTTKVGDAIFVDKLETIDLDEDVKAEISLDNISLDAISDRVFTSRYLKTL